MSVDETQPYVAPGAQPGDDDDQEKKPLVAWVGPFENTEADPVVIDSDDSDDSDDGNKAVSMESYFSETPSQVQDTYASEDDADPVDTVKHTTKQLIAASEGMGTSDVGLMGVFTANPIKVIGDAIDSRSMPRNNGGHHSSVVPPAASPAGGVPAGQPPLPRGPPPTPGIIKQEGETQQMKDTQCLGFDPNPWINGTRCEFSHELAKGGYLPSYMPKNGFGNKTDPRLCLGCMGKKGPGVLRTVRPNDQRVPGVELEQGASSAAADADADGSAAPLAGALRQDPRGGKTSTKRSKSESVPVRSNTGTKTGKWQQKADEQKKKAQSDAVARAERALAEATRKEMQAHRDSIQTLKDTAQATADALAIQQQKDATDRAQATADAEAAMSKITAQLKLMEQQNAELLRRLEAGEQSVQATPARGKEAADEPAAPRKRKLTASQVSGRGEGGSSSKAPAAAGEGGSSSGVASPVATPGGGERWLDAEMDIMFPNDGYSDGEAEESQEGDKTPKPTKQHSFIGYRGDPRRLHADDTDRPGRRGVSYSPYKSRGSDSLTGSDFCHLAGMPFDRTQDTVFQAQDEFYGLLIQQGMTADEANAQVDDPDAMGGFLKERAKEDRKYRLSQRNGLKQKLEDDAAGHVLDEDALEVDAEEGGPRRPRRRRRILDSDNEDADNEDAHNEDSDNEDNDDGEQGTSLVRLPSPEY